MKVYRLYRRQVLPVTLEESWAFFATPHTLEQMTPPFLKFRITSKVPEEIHSGLLITYRIAAIAGIPMAWVTEIKDVERLYRFVDEQRFGPFKFWHHQHHFRSVAGGTEMVDVVHYVMRYGWFGRWVHRWLVRPRLQKIFDFRRDYLEEYWHMHANSWRFSDIV